jgi:hypothetical protein
MEISKNPQFERLESTLTCLFNATLGISPAPLIMKTGFTRR